MAQYEAIAHVLWELPFPLRLPPKAFFIWEPTEGLALFEPKPEVGELAWKRKSQFLQAKEIFTDLGLTNQCYPTHDYLITSELASGKEIKTAILKRGPAGGFCEPRPYTIANIFLCLQNRTDYSSEKVLERAGAALNNILDVYRFVTMDPLVRSVRVDRDCYYTLVSVADLPRYTGEIQPREILSKIDTLPFGSTIGKDRIHQIGVNSFEDLLSGDILAPDIFRLFKSLISEPHNLELFHQLTFSAIRRLKRKEHALAVIDAQSAFESLVSIIIVEGLSKQRLTPKEIEKDMSPGGQIHLLQRRLEKLDKIVAAQIEGSNQPREFLNSAEEQRWRKNLYNLRNRIVHEGLRTIPFEEAKAGLVAGLHAMYLIQDLSPDFRRSMMWSDKTLDLNHIEQSSGRLSRLFES